MCVRACVRPCACIHVYLNVSGIHRRVCSEREEGLVHQLGTLSQNGLSCTRECLTSLSSSISEKTMKKYHAPQIEPSVEHNDSYIRWTRSMKEALHTPAGSSTGLSQYQCKDGDVGVWDHHLDRASESEGALLLAKDHWDVDVRKEVSFSCKMHVVHVSV